MLIPLVYFLVLLVGVVVSFPAIAWAFSFINLPIWLELLFGTGLSMLCGLSLQFAVSFPFKTSDESSKERQKDGLRQIKLLWLIAFALSFIVLSLYFISAKYSSDVVVQQLIIGGGTLFILFSVVGILETIAARREKVKSQNKPRAD